MTSAKKSKATVTMRKASKQEPEDFAHLPRKPMRGRGILRFQKLLDATEALLTHENPDDVGLYQIAAKAKVPPASVYHFFPTKEAAFVALAQSYADRLLESLAEPIDAAALRGWQDLTAIDMRRGMRFHNEHTPLMKINYGGYGGVAARAIDLVAVRRLAGAQYGRLNRIFHMPPMAQADDIFEMRLGIIDGIYGISFRRCGEITERYFQEAYNASTVFLGQFLPARLEPRDLLIAASARGELISLPFESLEEAVSPAPRRRQSASKP